MTLKDRIRDHSAVVGIMGMGYVGLPLAMEFAGKGFKVYGFEIDAQRAASLLRGVSYIPDVPSQTLGEHLRTGAFRPTADFDGLRRCDAVIICVPTPLRKTKDPDVSHIVRATQEIGKRLRRGQLIILESTTYPGTTEELVAGVLKNHGRDPEAKPLAAKAQFRLGRDFQLAFSPERVDPANRKYGIRNTPKVVGGSPLAALLYGQVVENVVEVRDMATAEMVKLLENTFRAVNIAMANEMALICHRLKIDVWEVVRAASSKPFGFMPFYPGPGLGGHCIPVDPSYLSWKMKELNMEARLIELATNINAHMPEHAVERLAEILNEAGKSLKGSRVLVLGVAYKAEVSDLRESPSLDVIKLLMEKGARVEYHDPFVPAVKFAGVTLRSRPLTPASLRAADVVAILTAHRAVDYRGVLKHARLVFDTRNATQGLAAPRGRLHRL